MGSSRSVLQEVPAQLDTPFSFTTPQPSMYPVRGLRSNILSGVTGFFAIHLPYGAGGRNR